MQERRRLDRLGLVAPQLAACVRVPRDDEAVGARLVLRAHHVVHVGLVDDLLADRRRRGGAAAQALPPHDPAVLRVQREEEALLLGEVHLPVADRGRELERVVRVDRPQPLVRRPQVVRRDVLARVVVAVRRPRPRVLRLRRRLRLRLLGRHELLRGGAALLGRFVLAADVQAHRDRDDDRDEPASHQQASSSHAPQDGKRVTAWSRPTAASRCALSLAAARG